MVHLEFTSHCHAAWCIKGVLPVSSGLSELAFAQCQHQTRKCQVPFQDPFLQKYDLEELLSVVLSSIPGMIEIELKLPRLQEVVLHRDDEYT